MTRKEITMEDVKTYCEKRNLVVLTKELFDEMTNALQYRERMVVRGLEKIPSVQPEQRTGKWERRIVDSGYNADWKCSECGYKEMTDFPTKYCPSCGTKMESEDKG